MTSIVGTSSNTNLYYGNPNWQTISGLGSSTFANQFAANGNEPYAFVNFYDTTGTFKYITIQGGGFEPGMKQKACGEPIDNEAANGLTNEEYTVAMARTSDPHSATAQFFINVKDNDFLNYEGPDNWGYCVFGKVTEGTDVVDTIRKVRTGTKGFHGDVPVEDVIIEKAEVI
jgi:peptidyl-prolyl cis-trans isomerase B (cyclophilin B)